MGDTSSDSIIVLTQRGRLPSPADFATDPEDAIERLRTEALRIQAEALICLSEVLGHLVGDRALDIERLANVAARAASLQSLLPLAVAVSNAVQGQSSQPHAIPVDVPFR